VIEPPQTPPALAALAPRRAFRALVEYDGTDFDGWQVQPGRRTVQRALEDAIYEITRQRVRVTGAGRTDKGVHAAGQVASFEILTTLTPGALRSGMNAVLARDVAVLDLAEAPLAWSARRLATARVYRYTIARLRSPLARRASWEMWARLDVARMREASKLLLGEHDMRSFSVAIPPEHSCIVRLTRIDWRETREDAGGEGCVLHQASIGERLGDAPFAAGALTPPPEPLEPSASSQGPSQRLWAAPAEPPLLVAELESNRFVRGMVRRLVGSLVLVGRGRWSVEDVARALAARDPRAGGPSAPARGLSLVRVAYPEPCFAAAQDRGDIPAPID
jgi:tRNA pseudouridine38-40 synthase